MNHADAANTLISPCRTLAGWSAGLGFFAHLRRRAGLLLAGLRWLAGLGRRTGRRLRGLGLSDFHRSVWLLRRSGAGFGGLGLDGERECGCKGESWNCGLCNKSAVHGRPLPKPVTRPREQYSSHYRRKQVPYQRRSGWRPANSFVFREEAWQHSSKIKGGIRGWWLPAAKLVIFSQWHRNGNIGGPWKYESPDSQ